MLNELSLQRGRGLPLNEKCTLAHPTLGEIENFGYKEYIQGETSAYGYEEYFQILYSLILISKDIADILWMEDDIWYEDITSEWDFFLQRCFGQTKTILIELNLDEVKTTTLGIAVDGNIKKSLNYFLGLDGEFVFVQKNVDNSEETQMFLCNTNSVVETENGKKYIINDDSFKFTEHYYNLTLEYLKKIHWLKPDYEFLHCGTKVGAKIMFKNTYKSRKKNRKDSINICTINSALNVRGISNTWDMPIYKFYDSYYRLNKCDEYSNTMSAIYSGQIDTKKSSIDEAKINWASIINI